MHIHIDTYPDWTLAHGSQRSYPNAARPPIALSCGTAAGAALIAASISMGNAPAARADVLGADPVSDLIGAFDPQALDAAGVSDTLALSYLIEAFDPNSFNASGCTD